MSLFDHHIRPTGSLQSPRLWKAALIISYFFNAPVVAIELVWLLYLMSPQHFGNFPGIFVFTHGFVFMFIIPMLPVLYNGIRGRTDLFVSNQKDRFYYFIFTVISYILGAITGWFFGSPALVLITLGYAAVVSCIIIVNHWEKVSVHVAGVAGPITFFMMLVNTLYLIPGIIVMGLVSWARLYLKAHTFKEVFLGAVIGVLAALFIIGTLSPLIL